MSILDLRLRDYVDFYASIIHRGQEHIKIKGELNQRAKTTNEYMKLYEWLQSEYEKAEGEKKKCLKDAICEMEKKLNINGVYMFNKNTYK